MSKPRQARRAERYQRLPDRKDAVMTSMVLPIELHRRARIAGLERNWSMAEVVRVAVAEWLERQERRTPR